MKNMSVFVTMILVFSFSGVAVAGWFDNVLENAIERTGERAVNEAADSAYDATKEKVTNPGSTTRNAGPKAGSGQGRGSALSPASARPAGQELGDEHFIMPDDYFIADRDLGNSAWIYVHICKMVTAPSQKTKSQGEFFQIVDGRNRWTKNYWQSRIAEESELKLGMPVIIFEGNTEDGVYLPPDSKEDARGRSWFMAKITDLSDTFKGYVTVSGNYKVSLANLRLVTK